MYICISKNNFNYFSILLRNLLQKRRKTKVNTNDRFPGSPIFISIVIPEC